MAEQNNPVEAKNVSKEQSIQQLNLSADPSINNEVIVDDLRLEPEQAVLNTEVKLSENTPVSEDVLDELDELDALIALEEEVLDLDIETAAGEQSDGGSSSAVEFSRDGAETIAKTAFETDGFALNPLAVENIEEGNNDGGLATDTINPEPVAVNDTGDIDFGADGQISNGLLGEYWGYDENLEGSNLSNIGVVTGYLEETPDADIKFIATKINYTRVPDESSSNYGLAADVNEDGVPEHLINFIGNDADSIVAINGGSSSSASDGIIKLSGNLNIETAGTYTLTVTHDDGFRLIVDGKDIFEFAENTAPIVSEKSIQFSEGLHTVELIYWDQGGQYVLDLNLSSEEGDNVWIDENLSYSDQSLSTAIDTAITLDLLANDTGDGITLNSLTEPSHGSIIINDDDTVVYTPDPDYTGFDSFSYNVIDEHGEISNTAIVTVTVVHNNDTGIIDVIDTDVVNISDAMYGTGGVDYLYGGSENDAIYGSGGNDRIRGRAGDDFLSGDTGDDIIKGEAGNDIVYGAEGKDTIYGGDGDDVLYGGTNDDTLDGGAGDDLLHGGAGDDKLTGGEGNDTFVWTTTDTFNSDIITDFNINEDKLDLSDLLIDASEDNLSQYLDFNVEGTHTTVSVSANAGGEIVQEIVLENVQLEGIDGEGVVSDTDKEVVINNLFEQGALIISDTTVDDSSNTDIGLEDNVV